MRMTGAGDFVGLANYARIGRSPEFLAALVPYARLRPRGSRPRSR